MEEFFTLHHQSIQGVSVHHVLMLGVGANPFITDWAKAAQVNSKVVGIRTSRRMPQRPMELGGGLFLDETKGIPVVLSPIRKRRPSRVFANWNATQQARAIVRAASWISENIGPQQLIHSHFASGSSGIPKAAKELGIPYVHTEHSSSLVWTHRGPSRTGIRILRHITSGAAVTTFVSGSLMRAVEQMGVEGRFTVISNPVDASIFPPAAQPSDPATLITIGSLIPRKRIDLIIEAFSLVIRNFPELRLQIVGSGPLKRHLSDFARKLEIIDNVIFMGYLKRSEVARLLSEATLYVHGSEAETFGVSLVEAQLAGLPVVTTNCGGVTADQQSPFMHVVEEPTARGLASAIREHLGSHQATVATRTDIANRAREFYSFDAVANQLAMIYGEVVG